MNGAVDEVQQTLFDIDCLPLGYRFCPKDAELLYYLTLKVHHHPLPVNNIKEVNLSAHHPEQLAERYCKAQGGNEGFYFTPRERKYPNGQRPKRAVGSDYHEQGYWKATGADKQIMSEGKVHIGYKKSLVFYQGKHPDGVKTNWIMHEFRLAHDPAPTTSHDLNHNHNHNNKMFEDYVLCRVYKKNSIDRVPGISGREEPNHAMNGALSSKSVVDDDDDEDDVVTTADSSPGMENVTVAEEGEEEQQPNNVEAPPSIGHAVFLQNNLQVVPPATGAGGGFLHTQNNNQLIMQAPELAYDLNGPWNNAPGRGRGRGGYMPRGVPQCQLRFI